MFRRHFLSLSRSRIRKVKQTLTSKPETKPFGICHRLWWMKQKVWTGLASDSENRLCFLSVKIPSTNSGFRGIWAHKRATLSGLVVSCLHRNDPGQVESLSSTAQRIQRVSPPPWAPLPPPGSRPQETGVPGHFSFLFTLQSTLVPITSPWEVLYTSVPRLVVRDAVHISSFTYWSEARTDSSVDYSCK